VAANVLARRGFKVLVLEANPKRAGGALGSEALTLPGFLHDVGGGFFPFGATSPAFRALDLPGAGVEWRHARYESCHPAVDGSVACIARGDAIETAPFGSPRDADTFRALARFHAGIERDLLAALLGPFPSVGPLLRVGVGPLLKIAGMFLRSTRGLATRLFQSEAARRVLPGLGLHVDVGPDDRFGAGLAYMLAVTATTGGYGFPKGGAQSLTNALVARLAERGGEVRLGARVTRVIVRNGSAAGVVLADGTEIATRRAVVHAGESVDDLIRFTREARAGRLPERPYLVIGQQSIGDPTRAPAGKHTLYCYSHVPSQIHGGQGGSDGWAAARERFADTVEARVEELAPGFRASILARHIMAPPDLEAWNANLVGGDLGGGSNAWHRQLVFRPLFPYFRYRMPVKGLYLCSSYAHPGAGVHGMCGANAAEIAARDAERR